MSLGNAALFAGVIATFEILSQHNSQQPMIMMTKSEIYISPERLSYLLSQGRMLVILESQVLDVEPFTAYHPGGVFVLQTRIGYSIDLPFNGHPFSGVESDSGANEGHMHSNEARQIAQSLVIGRYEVGSPPATKNKQISTKDSSQNKDSGDKSQGPGFDYQKSPIRVKPTDGWDDSSTYRFGKLMKVHLADVYRIERLEGISIMTPF